MYISTVDWINNNLFVMNHTIVKKFREILRMFERELDHQNNSSCCCGVTLSQCHALLELTRSDHISLNQLSERLSVDKSAASRTVESLVRKNLVQRNIPKENRRTTQLILTETGLRVSDQINRGNNDYYTNILEGIPAGDLELFLKTFEIITSRMTKLNKQ